MRALLPLALAACVGLHALGAAARPHRPRPSIDVSGVYQSNYDEVRLEQDGNIIRGSYVCCGGGSITGRIDGKVIRYHWAGSGGDEGRGVWRVISRDELHGTWGSGDSTEDGGEWNLSRASAATIAN